MESISSSSSSLESYQSKNLILKREAKTRTSTSSATKILLLILLLISSLHIFIELVLLFAEYLDERLSRELVKKPKFLIATLIAFSLFRTGQLLATMLDLPLAMFVLAWANLNLDVLLFARFTWYLFISGFSLTSVFLARLLMLLFELAIPSLTWCHLKALRRANQAREMEMVLRGGGGGALSRSISYDSTASL